MKYSSLHSRDKRYSCLLHYMIVLSKSWKLCHTGLHLFQSAWQWCWLCLGKRSWPQIQRLPMAATAYLKFSIPYSLWPAETRTQTPGKPVRQTRNKAKNSLVIETLWFKTTDFIVATCPAVRYKNASNVQSFQWSLPFNKHYFLPSSKHYFSSCGI